MTLITGKFVEFPRLVARNLNMYQAPNLNGIARRYIVRPQEKKRRRDTGLFSQSIAGRRQEMKAQNLKRSHVRETQDEKHSVYNQERHTKVANPMPGGG